MGQGFSYQTQVAFAAVDDTGKLGTVVRTGNASGDGGTLTVVVPALARTGAVRVQGSDAAIPLQVVPALRAVGGTVATGNTIVVEGTGLSVNDLIVTVDGQGAGTFSVRTTVDGSEPYDPWHVAQQFLTLVVPAGVSMGQIRVATAGGGFTLGGTSITSVAAVAASGTPANTSLASANVGQTILLFVANLQVGDRVVFTTMDSAGNLSERTVDPVSLDNELAVGTLAVVVPDDATTGRVRLERETSGVVLQIVPVVSNAWLPYPGISYDGHVSLTLSGSGFAEGLTSVHVGGTAIDDTSRSTGTDVSGNGHLSVQLPADPPTGPISVTTVGGASAPYAIALTGIAGTATSGTPADPAVASANPGDTLTLSGTNLSTDTWVIFQTVDNGGTVAVHPNSVAADGTSATVTVPLDAATGDVRILGSAAAYRLQIVPVVTDVRVEYVDNDARTVQVVLSGLGFVDNAADSLYTFGTQSFGDAGPNVEVFGGGYGQPANSRVRLSLPLSSDVLGAITAATAGGTSAAFTRSLSSITSTALSGTPADPTQASANAGQAITLTGSGLSTSVAIIFGSIDYQGRPRFDAVNPSTAAADGTSAEVSLPYPANGITSVWLLGSASRLAVQIVPTVSSVSLNGGTIMIGGTGFVEGATTYAFPNGTVVDGSTSDSGWVGIDVDWGSSDHVSIASSLLTDGPGTGSLVVTTAGGSSEPADVSG